MEVTEIIARLRSMNHLIELGIGDLPDLEDEDDEWLEGWIRFYDTTNCALVCVNESDTGGTEEDDYEVHDLGTVLVCSGNHYDTSVTIPLTQVEKYILAEQMKSNSLLAASQMVNSQSVNSKLSFNL